MKVKQYLLFDMKIVWIVLIWLLAMILHNSFYAVFKFEEPVFFIIAVFIIPLYVLLGIVYTIGFNFYKKHKKLKRAKKKLKKSQKKKLK